MSKIRFMVLMIVLLVGTFAQPVPSYGQTVSAPVPLHPEAYQFVSPTEGWILTDRLYWTKDAGQTWTDITPPNLGIVRVPTIAFINNQVGMLIDATFDSVNWRTVYTIIKTTDAGKTWRASPVTTSPETRLILGPGDISLQFLNANVGWLRIKQLTSANSDTGQLFKTVNGGTTWTQITLPRDQYMNAPLGDPVYFVTDQLGWIAGRSRGARGDSNFLYRTLDGGQTWETQTVGVIPFEDTGLQERVYQLPQFINVRDGLMVVSVSRGTITREVYITRDGGTNWELDAIIGGSGPVILLDSTHWISVIYGKGLVGRTIGQASTPTLLSENFSTVDIMDMKFMSSSAGLVSTWHQVCPPNPKSGDCIEERRLLYTSNGGQTWRPLTLPQTAQGDSP